MSDILSWPHTPTATGVIPSGVHASYPDGWTDNLDTIQTAVNSKLDKSGTVTSFPTIGADVPIGPKGTATALATGYNSYDLYLSGSIWDGAAAKYRRFLARTVATPSAYKLQIASRPEGSAETQILEITDTGIIQPYADDGGGIGTAALRMADVFCTTLDASEFANHLIPQTNVTWDIGSTTGPKRVRKIWGQDIDLTGTTQALGTITSGVWNGTAVAVGYGGTGLASGTSGGILGFTGATTLASSALLTANALVLGGGAGATPAPLGSLGTTATLLHGNAAGAPTWGAVALASEVSGTLPVANGGTGIVSGTDGGILGFTAAGTIASSALLAASQLVLGGGAGATPSTLGSLGTTAQVLHGNAAGAPTWGAVALGTDVSGQLPIANGGTGQATAAAGFDALSPMSALGDLIYGGALGTRTRLAGNIVATRMFLRQLGDGANSAAPAWDTVTKADVGLGSVENTALSTWAGTTNITTLGTIATGVWNGTAIAVANGGTGATDAAAAAEALGVGLTDSPSFAALTLSQAGDPSLTQTNTTAANVANVVNVTHQLKSDAATRAAFGITTNFSTIADGTRTATVTLQTAASGVFDATLTFVGRNATFAGSVITIASMQAAAAATNVSLNASGQLQQDTSSIRFKENVTDMAEWRQMLAGLRPRTFDWCETIKVDAVHRHDFGFIAEEAAAVDSRIASYSKGNVQSVRYQLLVAPLVAGWQDHDARIAALEAKCA